MLGRVYFHLPAILLLTLNVIPLSFSQEAKLEQLLQRSPLPANSICYLHTPSLKKLLIDAKLDVDLADKVEEVWLVSDLDIEAFKPTWEAGYATLQQQVDVDSLAKAVGGYVDTIANQKVVWTPKQSYVLPVAQDAVGFLRPAKRELLTQWIEETARHSSPAYLASQAKQPEQYLSFMLAISLKNSFSPVILANRVAAYDSLKTQDPAAIAKLFASVQGISIIVGRNSLSECIFSVEFGESPASLSAIASTVFNEVLNRNGVSAPEVAMWKSKVDGNKLFFQGPISAESLDGVLGIFSIRGFAEEVSDTLAPMSQSTQGGTSAIQIASKEYFDKVNAFIERVRKYEAQSTGYRAKWDEQQARRIDELGTLNVDPLLIDYGANIASILRGNSTAIRTGNVAAGQLQAAQSQSGGYGYYGEYYGGYYGVREAGVTKAQQRMGAGGSYRQAIAQIDQLTGDTRRAMTAKYKIQF
jgi:hypothetical protein